MHGKAGLECTEEAKAKPAVQSESFWWGLWIGNATLPRMWSGGNVSRQFSKFVSENCAF